MIYFLENPKEHTIKIGYTNAIPRRKHQLETTFEVELTLLGIMPGLIKDEKQLHLKFAEHWIESEWFHDHVSIREFIAANAQMPTLDTQQEATDPKVRQLVRIRSLLLEHPEGVTFADLVAANDGRESSTWRYLQELEARLISRGVYTLDPTEIDIELARAVLKRIGE